jgi:hypothetical protein
MKTQGNLHVRVSPELYVELRDRAESIHGEADWEFACVPIMMYVRRDRRCEARLYVGDDSISENFRIQFKGKEGGSEYDA